MELDRLKFKADYAADSEKSFVVVTREGLKSSDIVDFQVEMISKTKIPGVLEFYLREIDMEMRFYYNVTGLINLSNFLRRRTINKDEFIEILEGITHTLMQSKRYLLTDRCFVLMENFIYIDPVKLRTHLIYIPVDDRTDLFQSFRTLVNNLLIDGANIETNDNFVQKVLGIIKKEGLCLSDFLIQLKKLKSAALPSDDEQKGYQGSCDRDSDMGPKLTWDKPHFSKAIEERKLYIEESCAEAASSSSGLNMPMIFGVALLGLISGSLFYMKKASLPTVIPQLLQRYSVWTGVAILTGIIGILAFFKIKEQYKERELGFHAGLSQSAAASQGSQQQDILESFPFMDKSVGAVVGTNVDEIAGPNTDEAACTHSDETVLLTESKHPMLISLGGNDKFVLNKPDLVIGRNKEICDCIIENKSVGRAHARITTTKGRCFITDLDSTNGTFVNGTKLISNKEYEIKYNDKILFANVEFCYQPG